MNGTLKYDAEYIKTLLVDYYINQYENIVIGSEVMYGTEKRIVDMLILKSGRTIAIEIKSKYDSFSRLEDQIIEYRKIFHYVYVAIDESFVKKLDRFYLPEDVGIIIISNNEQIKVYRKAKIQGGLEKKEILHTVNVDYIKNYYSKAPNGNSDEIRLLLEKKSLKSIEILFYEFLTFKIKPRYELFLSQRGNHTHTDDVFLLSFQSKMIL